MTKPQTQCRGALLQQSQEVARGKSPRKNTKTCVELREDGEEERERKINETQSQFFEKSNKMYKLLARETVRTHRTPILEGKGTTLQTLQASKD